MNPKAQALLDHSDLFRCPLCQGDLTPGIMSLGCPTGHVFNVSKKGSVNFVPAQKPLFYTSELFDARGRIFERGFYEPLLKALEKVLLGERRGPLAPDGRLRITDAGCGQGWYSKELASQDDFLVTGFDLSPDAISQASSGAHRALFMVADVTNIPLRDHSQDVVLDILTQANYQEFRRILKPGGLVVKVMPGEHYLREIRQLLKGQLRRDTYSDEPVVEHFFAKHEDAAVTPLLYNLPLDHESARDFLRMTPMAQRADQTLLDPSKLPQITIHLNILTGRYQAQTPV